MLSSTSPVASSPHEGATPARVSLHLGSAGASGGFAPGHLFILGLQGLHFLPAHLQAEAGNLHLEQQPVTGVQRGSGCATAGNGSHQRRPLSSPGPVTLAAAASLGTLLARGWVLLRAWHPQLLRPRQARLTGPYLSLLMFRVREGDPWAEAWNVC